MSQYLKLGMVTIGLLMNVTASAHNSVSNDKENNGREGIKLPEKYYVKFATSCKDDVFSKLQSKNIEVISELVHDNVFIVKMKSDQVKNVASEPCVDHIEPVPKRQMHEDTDPFAN
ncbi:hypothetical protein [Vibrio penaeicida]|uniref:hypothetical protein n=1 Tax=Vibrio penaeicida TaxID=104609 RepID=UPI0011AB4389|nr:hypothetical protein [Vibrio penaeicida]